MRHRPSLAAATLAVLGGCARTPAEPSGAAGRNPTTVVVASGGTIPPTRAAPTGAAAVASGTPGTSAGAAPPFLPRAGARAVSGSHGVVTSVEAHATRAGVEILERGGNAADAAVAVAYALAVTHPNAGNLGGGGFLLYRPKGGPTTVVDFREKAPHGLTQARFDRMLAAGAVGPAAAAVPGSVAGLNLALARFGRLSRDVVMEPAIRLARDGFPLGVYQAKALGWAWRDLSKDPAARSVFGDGKRPRAAGDRLVQRALAETLGRIARDGDAGFYAGPTAAALASLGERGGLITEADLAAYHAVLREPLVTHYRGLTVEVPPPPSAGGVAVGIELALLEHLETPPLPLLTAPELHLFAEVARRAHAIRRFEVGDPDTDPAFDVVRSTAEWFDAERVLARSPGFDPTRRTPSAQVHPLYAAALKELEHTTHLSVVDGEGNAASLTTTLSASFGSRAMAAGVLLNNAVAAFGTVGRNVPAPDRHMTTSMSPSLVLWNGDPVVVLGSPGGDTIPNTVVRVLRGLVDYGLALEDAVDAPRVHHGFVPDEVRYEGGRPPAPATLAELKRLGHHLSCPTRSIGDANVIVVSGGVAHAYADPREGGAALAAREAAQNANATRKN